ncbi:hypothetical protein HPB47_027924 [Ixodes persulcatus]|uniref:Uncharacterized protein n=1 Tax=Ixodes persulcatus TaxID=34615 RepID=A0AC60PUM2_IXOPE|nr:hypothetical protein HPB47_027924 [Ixodes persulcatus]
MAVDFTATYKILVLGDSNVGKTCIVHRFCDERFYDTYISTIARVNEAWRVLQTEVTGETGAKFTPSVLTNDRSPARHRTGPTVTAPTRFHARPLSVVLPNPGPPESFGAALCRSHAPRF